MKRSKEAWTDNFYPPSFSFGLGTQIKKKEVNILICRNNEQRQHPIWNATHTKKKD